MQVGREVLERLRRSTVQVIDGRGGGAGVVWDANGLMVTNAHVARGVRAVIVDASGKRAEGRVVRRDSESDLALIEVGRKLEDPAAIGDSESLRTGQIVIAVGNPLGVTGAISVGVIHAIGPLDAGGAPFLEQRNWIQADIRLAPGNSGGLLADAKGRLIGINTMIFRGIGLAVPSNDVREFVTGESDRVRLGVELVGVQQGLIVIAIERDSIAENTGILTGDIFLCPAYELRRLLSKAKQTGSVEIPMLRAGRKQMLRLRVSHQAGARAA